MMTRAQTSPKQPPPTPPRSPAAPLVEVTDGRWLEAGYWEGLLAMALGAGARLQVVAPKDGSGFGRSHVGLARAAARVCGATWDGDVGGHVGTLSPHAAQDTAQDEAPDAAHHLRLGLGVGVGRLLAAILPAAGALAAERPLRLHIEGSTHAPSAPSVDHWAWAMPPLLAEVGVSLSVQTLRAGFPPAGGGAVSVEVTSRGGWRAGQWLARGPITERRAVLWIAHLHDAVGARQARALSQHLGWSADQVEVRRADDALSAGNAASLVIGDGRARAVLSSVGALGVNAEAVVQAAVSDLQRVLASAAPIDGLCLRHLLTPALMAGAGVALCAPPDPVTRALLALAPAFFPSTPATLTRDEDGSRRAFWLRVGPDASPDAA